MSHKELAKAAEEFLRQIKPTTEEYPVAKDTLAAFLEFLRQKQTK